MNVNAMSDFLNSVFPFLVSFALITVGHLYAEKAGREINEKKYEKAVPSIYLAFVYVVVAILTPFLL